MQELAEANLELSKLEQALSVAADKTDRSIIRALDGIVNRVLISTVGGVLKAGEPLVEIVPLNSELVLNQGHPNGYWICFARSKWCDQTQHL